MELDIRMDGLDALAEALHARLEDVLPAAAVGVGKAAKAVEKTARKLAPVAPVNGGNLRKSIRASAPEIKDGAAEANVAATAAHSVYVEMGTGPKGAAKHAGIDPTASPTYRTNGWVYPLKDGSGFRYTEGMPACPFMYPAFKQNEQKAKDTIADEVRKAVGA